jgi:hypothetical protein
MPDEEKTRDVIDAVKGVLEEVPAYQDAVQPAAKELGTAMAPAGNELGKAVVTVAKSINLALAPFAALVWGYDQIREFVLTRLEEKFKSKPHRFVPPNLVVAGPTIEALKYAGHEPILREMYINLLATAMDAESAHKAHPAFVEIIRQLLPDEARLLNWLATHESKHIKMDQNDRTAAVVKEYAEPAACAISGMIWSYIDNLQRVGLVRYREGLTGTIGGLNDEGSYAYTAKLEMTDFGRQFYEACMGTTPAAS